MTKRKRHTNKQLERLCQKWQARMRLQDWDVSIRWAKQSEMMGPGVEGQCSAMAVNKCARIMLCEDAEEDIEYLVVHELGHLHLDPLSTRSNVKHVEQALHGFVHALMGRDK